MLAAIIVFFVIAAVFGAVVLTAVLRNKSTPKFMVLMHGTFAFIALLMLIAYLASGPISPMLITSITLLVLAALGGFTLLTFDLKNKPIPKALALAHPFVAIIGVAILIVYLFMYVL